MRLDEAGWGQLVPNEDRAQEGEGTESCGGRWRPQENGGGGRQRGGRRGRKTRMRTKTRNEEEQAFSPARLYTQILFWGKLPMARSGPCSPYCYDLSDQMISGIEYSLRIAYHLRNDKSSVSRAMEAENATIDKINIKPF